MAKAWPQAGGSTLFSSLNTKIQMASFGPPDLELGTRLHGSRHPLVFDGQSQAKQGGPLETDRIFFLHSPTFHICTARGLN